MPPVERVYLDALDLPDTPPSRPVPDEFRTSWLVYCGCGEFTQYEMRLWFWRTFGREPDQIAVDHFMGEQFWWLGWVTGWELPGREHEHETLFGRDGKSR